MRLFLSVISTIAFLVCAYSPADAQWAEDGVPVISTIENQNRVQAVPDGEGGLVWTDGQVWPWVMLGAQRIDPAGFLVWPVDLVQVSTADTIQLDPVAAPSGDGGVVIAWVSKAGTVHSVRAQKISAEGTVLWTSDGVLLSQLDGVLDEVRICSDGSGGAVVAWLDNRSAPLQVYAQRISPDGSLNWAAGGFAVTSSPVQKESLDIDSDGYGGMFCVWEDKTNEDIYAEWVRLDQYLVWGSGNGTQVCGEINAQENPSIIADGAGGAIVCWDDYRADAFGDIYAQKLEPQYGAVMWQSDVPVCGDVNIQGAVTMVSDGAAGAIFVWLDGRNTGNSSFDIYAQRFDGVGTPLWSGDGILVCGEPGLKYSPVAVSDGNGGAIIAWDDRRSGSGSDVYAQRIDGNYNLLWDEEGAAVCTSPFDQIDVSIAADAMGNAIFAWDDDRNLFDTDIYAQRIDRFGVWGFAAPHIVSVRDVPGDEGGYVNISWNASRLDVHPHEDIFYYTIWRAIDEELAMSMAGEGAVIIEEGTGMPVADPSSRLIRRTLLGGEPYFWTEVATVESSRFIDCYAETIATLFDSTAAAFEYHYFQIIAHAHDPSRHWVSAPDSGYSVDDLAPGAPLGLAGEQFFTPVGLRLSWEGNSESDLASYRIYRGADASFVPGQGNLIVVTADEEYFDGEWTWDAGYWYKVSAVDVNDNESAHAVLAPDIVTGDDPMPVPAETFLAQNYPNPFNPITTIAFGLKSDGSVNLSVYDAAGRLVTELINESRPAGKYATVWNGRSKNETPAASGVYFYKLVTEEFSKTRKMILLR
jgi:hypothetical protein